MANAGSIRPESVAFDCDGVLVDSEPIANRVMAEAIAGLGWPLSTADCIAQFKGHHFDTLIAAVEDRLGRPVPEEGQPELRAAGARRFRDMGELPGLIGLG